MLPLAKQCIAGLAGFLFSVCVAVVHAEPASGRHGMVVTAQHLATEAGVDVLKKGGNAIDAAVAVGYALAVVYPGAGNLGGGGFMTIRFADGRRTFVDFREKAPLAATRDMYVPREGAPAPSSTSGHLAVAVPGSVAGLEYARAKWGTMPRAQLIAPAIALAENGFVLDGGDVEILQLAAPGLRADPASAAIFLDAGQPLRKGARLVQRDLARTLREVAQHGADGFYKGWVAAAIVASNRAGGGILSQADFDAYRPRELAPVECDYRGNHVISAPPPSSGGATVCEILHVIEGYPMRELGFHSAQAAHYEIEAMRRSFLDRNNALGDPAFIDNPLARFVDKAYAAKIRAQIDPRRADNATTPASPPREGTNTTHYSIVDGEGNAVSVTTTLNEWFGAQVTAAGTGVVLNDEMDDFTTRAGKPNLYGLVQGEQNAIAPGKTPLSSMTPTIVTKDGRLVLVTGAPGGSRIISAVVHTIVNVVDYGMNVEDAVNAPRFHQQWQPPLTYAEPGAFASGDLERLEAMGHGFKIGPVGGQAAAIVARPDGYEGAIDRRRSGGLALGF